jgi:CRP/FNR family transcriptional regulator, anaerobic regulatory protein
MNPDRFVTLRPEVAPVIQRGDEKVNALMQGSGRSFPAGHVLIRAGSEDDYVYRLRSGWACRNRAIADGRDQIILIFVPGDLFAVKSLFLTRQPDSVQLLSAAVIERVNHVQLREAYAHDPDISNRCMWQVIEEERRLHSWIFSLGQASAEERLAMLVMDLRGRLALAGAISMTTASFEFPLTQVQIAEYLGITPVHANRIVKSFREKGIVVFQAGKAIIKDFAELRRIAHPLMDAFERSVPEYNIPVAPVAPAAAPRDSATPV